MLTVLRMNRALIKYWRSMTRSIMIPAVRRLASNGLMITLSGYRRLIQSQVTQPGQEEVEPPPVPSQIQTEALAALAHSRDEGFRRGLVVMATGLGKTWLAAFDSEQVNAKRVLFVAHREEILEQSRRNIRAHTA